VRNVDECPLEDGSCECLAGLRLVRTSGHGFRECSASSKLRFAERWTIHGIWLSVDDHPESQGVITEESLDGHYRKRPVATNQYADAMWRHMLEVWRQMLEDYLMAYSLQMRESLVKRETIYARSGALCRYARLGSAVHELSTGADHACQANDSHKGCCCSSLP
jgi:hypothetical protein